MNQLNNPDIVPQSKIQDLCNKHPDKKGEYFQMDCPWVKYCETCALNIALCGKKIQKNLTSTEMFNKITLTELLKQLQINSKQSQLQHNEYSVLIKQTQKTREYFTTLLSQIQKYIETLTQYKNQLQQTIYENLTKQLKCLFQRQNILVSKKFQLHKNISKIQCDFMVLLKENQKNNLQERIKNCKKTIEECQQIFITSNYKQNTINNINQIKIKFEQNIQLINQTKINIPLQELKHRLLTQNYPYDTLNQQSSIDVYYGKILSDPNSTNISGLISRAQTIGQDKNTLKQINMNRRNSRATLQLRTRCNTKSTKKYDKQKILIDVREEVKENYHRIKTKS